MMHLLDETAFDRLADDLLDRLPVVSASAREVGLALYHLLADGEPVTYDQLAQRVGRNPEDVARVIEELRGLVHSEGKSIIGFGGLAVRPMTHRILRNDRQLYTWCAWDSLFVTHLLDAPTRIESLCPETKSLIQLEVTPAGVARVHPAATVMSIMLPESGNFDQDAAHTMRGFCHFVHFLALPSAAAAWVKKHAGAAVLRLDQAFALDVRLNQSRCGVQ